VIDGLRVHHGVMSFSDLITMIAAGAGLAILLVMATIPFLLDQPRQH